MLNSFIFCLALHRLHMTLLGFLRRIRICYTWIPFNFCLLHVPLSSDFCFQSTHAIKEAIIRALYKSGRAESRKLTFATKFKICAFYAYWNLGGLWFCVRVVVAVVSLFDSGWIVGIIDFDTKSPISRPMLRPLLQLFGYQQPCPLPGCCFAWFCRLPVLRPLRLI